VKEIKLNVNSSRLNSLFSKLFVYFWRDSPPYLRGFSERKVQAPNLHLRGHTLLLEHLPLGKSGTCAFSVLQQDRPLWVFHNLRTHASSCCYLDVSAYTDQGIRRGPSSPTKVLSTLAKKQLPAVSRIFVDPTYEDIDALGFSGIMMLALFAHKEKPESV